MVRLSCGAVVGFLVIKSTQGVTENLNLTLNTYELTLSPPHASFRFISALA